MESIERDNDLKVIEEDIKIAEEAIVFLNWILAKA
jgi:hypothetical protein